MQAIGLHLNLVQVLQSVSGEKFNKKRKTPSNRVGLFPKNIWLKNYYLLPGQYCPGKSLKWSQRRSVHDLDLRSLARHRLRARDHRVGDPCALGQDGGGHHLASSADQRVADIPTSGGVRIFPLARTLNERQRLGRIVAAANCNGCHFDARFCVDFFGDRDTASEKRGNEWHHQQNFHGLLLCLTACETILITRPYLKVKGCRSTPW